MSVEERLQMEARIKVSGMSKGQYFIQSLLKQELNIAVGKYQSDRLSLEIKRLREALSTLHDKNDVIAECKALLGQLVEISAGSDVQREQWMVTKEGGQVNQDNTKTTAPLSSVGADDGQSLSKGTNQSITEIPDEINNYDEWQKEMLREMDKLYV